MAATQQEFKIKGYDYVKKKVLAHKTATSGYLYLDLKWKDKEVAVVLLEPLE